MSIIFSSGRNQLSNDDWSITTNPNAVGSNLVAGTYYFSLQGRNRVGLNLPVYRQITIVEDASITITLFSTSYKAGENWKDLVISCSTFDNPTQYKQIIAIPFKYDGTETVSESLPYTIEITEQSDLDVVTSATTTIPDTNYFNGRLVFVNSLSSIFEFNRVDNTSLVTIDNVNNFVTANGIYRRKNTAFNNLTDIYDYKGCNLDIRSDLTLLDHLALPTYTLDGSDSEKIRFSILNATDNAVPVNSLITLEAFINNVESVSLLENSIKVKYIGFCNNTTGALRTSYYELGGAIPEIGQEIIYSVFSSNLFLPDDLQAGESFIIEIYLTLNPVNFSSLFNNNAGLFIYPTLQSTFSTFNSFYTLFKKAVIVESLNECNIVPLVTGNVEVQSGEIIFDGYSTTRNFNEEIYLPSEAELDLVLELSGNIITEEPNSILSFKATKLASIKKEIGFSKVSSPQTITVTANKGIRINLSTGVTLDNLIPVRGNYPNMFLQGKSYTPYLQYVTVFIELSGTIYKATEVLANTVTEDITITSITGLPTVASVNLTEELGLINSPVINTLSEVTGTLSVGTYTIYLGYEYTGLEVTDILNTLPVFNVANLFSNGSGTGNANFNKIAIFSTPTTTLDLKNNTVIDLQVTGNTTLAEPSLIEDGATITLVLRNNSSINVITFNPYFIFETTFTTITLNPDAIVVIKLELYSTFALSYITFQKNEEAVLGEGFGNDFQLNNNNQLTN